MTSRTSPFLPGVPEDRVRTALAAAGGNEIESGKLDSPQSSAVLAVNAFGWFVERPADLPRSRRWPISTGPPIASMSSARCAFHGAGDAIRGWTLPSKPRPT